jgi:hypothetical protein
MNIRKNIFFLYNQFLLVPFFCFLCIRYIAVYLVYKSLSYQVSYWKNLYCIFCVLNCYELK